MPYIWNHRKGNIYYIIKDEKYLVNSLKTYMWLKYFSTICNQWLKLTKGDNCVKLFTQRIGS